MINVIKAHNQRLALVLFRVLKKYILRVLKLRIDETKLKKRVLIHFNSPQKVAVETLFSLAQKELQLYIKKRETTSNEKKLHCILKEYKDTLEVIFIENFYTDLGEEYENNFLPDVKKLIKNKNLTPSLIPLQFSNFNHIAQQIEAPYLKYESLPYETTNLSIMTMYSELKKNGLF
jgi:hypothetical protein